MRKLFAILLTLEIAGLRVPATSRSRDLAT